MKFKLEVDISEFNAISEALAFRAAYLQATAQSIGTQAQEQAAAEKARLAKKAAAVKKRAAKQEQNSPPEPT